MIWDFTDINRADDAPRIMKLREVMAQLGVCRETIDRLVRNGKLPAFRVGSDFRFLRTDVEALREHWRAIR